MFEHVEKVILQQVNYSGEIQPSSRLEDDIGVCSFDMMVIIYELEKQFNVKIDTSKFKKQMTIQDLSDLLTMEIVNNG